MKKNVDKTQYIYNLFFRYLVFLGFILATLLFIAFIITISSAIVVMINNFGVSLNG